MTIPQHFESEAQYVNKLDEFLTEFKWIYYWPNTQILCENILDNIGDDWIQHNFNDIEAKLDVPLDLMRFRKLCEILKPNYKTVSTEKVELNNSGKISLKKLHEITIFAPYIAEMCSQNDITHVIDIGAGLGYLSQLLYEQYGISILAIEGCAKNVQAAIAIQQRDFPHSQDNVHYEHHFITESSSVVIRELVAKCFNGFNQDQDHVAIVGLHACADLSVTIMNIFTELKFASAMAIMPCCYHRMRFDQNFQRFSNFPLSDELKSIQCNFFNGPFLRLACQQSGALAIHSNDYQRRLQAQNCLFRAIIEDVAKQMSLRVSRKKRKKGTSQKFSVENAIFKLAENYSLKTLSDGQTVDWDTSHTAALVLSRWHDMERMRMEVRVEMFCSLQSALQPVLENVVLVDRVLWMRRRLATTTTTTLADKSPVDRAEVRCQVEKITDEHLSPRCYVLRAHK